MSISPARLLPCHTSRELRFQVSTKFFSRVAKNQFPSTAPLSASKRRSDGLTDSMVNPALGCRAYFYAPTPNLLTVFRARAVAFLFKLQSTELGISSIPCPRERVYSLPIFCEPLTPRLFHPLAFRASQARAVCRCLSRFSARQQRTFSARLAFCASVNSRIGQFIT